MKKSTWPLLAIALVFAAPAVAQNVPEHKEQGVTAGNTSHQTQGGERGITSGSATGAHSTMGNVTTPSGQPGQPGMAGSKSGPAVHPRSHQSGESR